MDDAVLNCCDHILEWKKGSIQVRVISIFTIFQTRFVSQIAREYIEISGCKSIAELEQVRISEDMKAMSHLDTLWNHLDFVDGTFRCNEGKPIYQDIQSLFSGVISPEDFQVLTELRLALRQFRNYGKFVVPIGIGKNIDHIIVKKIAEEMFGPSNLHYYVDFPYALSPRAWTSKNAIKVLRSKKTIKWITRRKRELLKIYSSQIESLFNIAFFCRIDSYPEIILHPE